MKAGRALVLAACANAALLLGCTALQNLQGTNTNKPAGSPTPTATPIGAALAAKFAPLDKRLEEQRTESKAGLKETGELWAERAKASRRAIDAITPAQERAVGQAAALNIIQQSGGLILEEGLVHYVNGVANLVASKGERAVKTQEGKVRIRARRFFVGILDDPGMNAYALPGGYILLTRGLVENLQCESDLAWVLGHEIVHIDNEHGLKALKIAVGGNEFLTQLSGTKDGESNLDNENFFAKVADKLAAITYKSGLDKDEELLGDRIGLEYSTKAGYDSRAPKRVLELLATNPAKVRIFASHDTPARRLEILGPLVEKEPNGKLGVETFDKGAIQRFEATKTASVSPTP